MSGKQKKPSKGLVAVVHLTPHGAIIHGPDCPVTQEAKELFDHGANPDSPEVQAHLRSVEKQTHAPDGSRTFSIPWGSGSAWDGTAGRKN